MKKKLIRSLSLLLTLCMLVTLLPAAALAADGDDAALGAIHEPETQSADDEELTGKVQFDVLTSLGDSIGAGFGLPSYEAYAAERGKEVCDEIAVEGSFVKLVADYFGAEAYQHAHCSWRA